MFSVEDIIKIWNKLQDEESRYIFDLRYKYYINNNYSEFITGLLNMEKDWTVYPKDNIQPYYNGQKIIIYGAGVEGIFTCRVLEKSGYDIFAFCDGNPNIVGTLVEGKKVLSVDDVNNMDKKFIILASSFHWWEMFSRLGSDYRFKRENLFIPISGAIMATCGDQYFDCPNVFIENGDSIIDAGVYDGETCSEMLKRFNCKKIIGFEPNEEIYEKARERFQKESKVKIYPYATWNKKENLFFSSWGGGSHVSQKGKSQIVGESIDNIVDGEEINFIKMDVEGSEYKAIQGAKNTIEKYHPKLAISIYHKPEDIVVLPKLILTICPDYKFYLRHYTSRLYETVLYAKC